MWKSMMSPTLLLIIDTFTNSSMTLLLKNQWKSWPYVACDNSTTFKRCQAALRDATGPSNCRNCNLHCLSDDKRGLLLQNLNALWAAFYHSGGKPGFMCVLVCRYSVHTRPSKPADGLWRETSKSIHSHCAQVAGWWNVTGENTPNKCFNISTHASPRIYTQNNTIIK